MATLRPSPHVPPTPDHLACFLKGMDPAATEMTAWYNGTVPLQETLYLTEALPPQELVTSVRCLLMQGDRIMVLQDDDGTYYIVPGGQRELGETLLQTLGRELLEETGWLAGGQHQLGFLHFRHLAPRPADWPYLYPDFLQVVYSGNAVAHCPERQLPGVYELGAAFRPICEAEKLSLGAIQHRLLRAACARRSAP